jgi:hypothetical protein
MSSIAVFLVLGGATAFAATKIGASQLKANSVKTGKIVKEAVTEGKIKNGAVTTNKLADGAVTTAKLADNAATGAKVDEASLGVVPTAANAQKLEGQTASSFVARNTVLWAIVNEAGALVQGSGAVSASKLSTGDYRVVFNRVVTSCVSGGTATDVTGGAAPEGAGARIIGTDNRQQAAANTSSVDVTTTDPAGALADPGAGDGFMVTVYC